MADKIRLKDLLRRVERELEDNPYDGLSSKLRQEIRREFTCSHCGQVDLREIDERSGDSI